MNELVDNVAKAICNDGLSVDLWADLDESARNGFRYSARAAIAAMREPTPEMVEAGFTDDAFMTPDLVPQRQKYNPKAVYKDMIDAALAEKEG